MKRTIAIALLSLSSMTAFAQTTPDVPPTQPAAGNPGKFTKPAMKAPAATTTDAAAAPAKMTKAERSAARKAKRAAKVGDKPIN